MKKTTETHPILRHLPALEAALVAANFPPMSPWWSETITRFYRSGRRSLIIRAGRRAGKSSTLCRVGVLEALYGEHKIHPGDVGIVGIVSVRREESASKLRTIRAILSALSVPYRERGETIELLTRPIVFAVFTASGSGLVGGTWACGIGDEVPRWRDAESGANPATEVLAALRPTMATMPNAKLFLCGSPLGQEDAHAKAFDQGDDDYQQTAFCPTWIGNPTLTEADTHAIEKDPRIWAREFAAQPQASSLAAFDEEDVRAACSGAALPDGRDGSPVMVIDAAGAGSDCWTYGIASVRVPSQQRYETTRIWERNSQCWIDVPVNDAEGKRIACDVAPAAFAPIVRLTHVGGFEGALRQAMSADRIVDQLATLMRRVGARFCFGDQWDSFSLESMFATRGLRFSALPWTNPSKASAAERLRLWLRERTISLPKHDALERQLLSFDEVLTPNGSLTFRGRRGGKDDYSMLAMLVARISVDGLLPMSPNAARRSGVIIFPDGTRIERGVRGMV